MTDGVPSHARVVVIGGGVVGASVAYHLAKLGCRDVLLLERSNIGSGTTWHAAGNMETYRADPLIGEMIRYAVEFYPQLEAETGQALGWRQSGRVMFTSNAERLAQYRGLPALGRARDVVIELLTPREVVEKLPIVSEKGILGGAWIPSDGRINPTDLAVALARGAKLRGARVIENEPVVGMTVRNGRISAVATASGEIKCETVVIAAGLWSPRLGAMIGVRVPLHAVQHFYILTKPLDIVSRDMPLFISYDERIYGREDVGGLLVGFFDSNAIPVSPADLPKDFSFGLLDSNWAQIEPNMAVALARFPVLEKAEVRLLLNGPESFTPDVQMLLGETPAVRGCFVATGMNSSGIALSACAGRLTAEWILDGRPSLDATRLDIRRFAETQGVTTYLRDRATEGVTHMCRVPTPDLDFIGTRMIRRSPLHGALAALGAQFVSVLGWERPIWFAAGAGGAAAQADAEVEAAESGIAFFDCSSDGKLWLEGPRAVGLLRKLSGAVAKPLIGTVFMAPMLNGHGGVEALPAIARMGADRWLLLCEAEQMTRLKSWMDWHRPSSGTSLVDVTSGWAAFRLVGPRARALLQSLSLELPDALDGVREIELGYASALLVPGLPPAGYYLMLRTEFALGAYEQLIKAGEAFGLHHAGSLAAEALAIRHGLRRFGSEVTPQVSAVAAGVDGWLDAQGNRGFIGRQAVLRDRRKRPSPEIRLFGLASIESMPFTNAPVLWQERPAGHITSGTVVPSLGKALLLALVERHDDDRQYSVVIQGRVLPLTVCAAPGA